jgi:hypothetical protein
MSLRNPKYARESTIPALMLLRRHCNHRPMLAKYTSNLVKPYIQFISGMHRLKRSICNNTSGFRLIKETNRSKYHPNRGICLKAGRLLSSDPLLKRDQVSRLSRPTHRMCPRATPHLRPDLLLCSNCNVITPQAHRHRLRLLIPGPRHTPPPSRTSRTSRTSIRHTHRTQRSHRTNRINSKPSPITIHIRY